MGGVAIAVHEPIDGLSWPAAFVLGAVVAPTDPVAATAIFSRTHVPERVGLLVEGEAMINDAFALVAFRVALTAAIAGSFSAAEAGSSSSFSPSAAWRSASWLGLAAGGAPAEPLEDGLLSTCSRRGSRMPPTWSRRRRMSRACWRRSSAPFTSAWFAHDAFSADTPLSAAALWQVLGSVLSRCCSCCSAASSRRSSTMPVPVTVGTLRLTALALAVVAVAIRATASPPFARTGDDWCERLAIDLERHARRGLARRRAVGAATVTGQPVIATVTVVVILVTLVCEGLTLPAAGARSGASRRCCVCRPTRPSRGGRPPSPRSTGSTSSSTRAASPRSSCAVCASSDRARFRACQAALGGGEQEGAADVREMRRRYTDLAAS